jgi:zinc protease
MEEVLFRPQFTQEDFQRLKNKQLEDITNRKTQPWALAIHSFNKVLYGDGHPMSVPTIGTSETVEKLTLADVRKYYQQFLAPNVSRMVIIGDVGKDDILPHMDFMREWNRQEVAYPSLPETPEIDTTEIFLVDKKGSAQSVVLIGYLAMPYDATGEYYKSTLMNYSLGGSFVSRINLNLREEKDWTYGARSRFDGTEYAGPFMAYGGIKRSATDSAVVEFLKEIRTFAENGITPDELESMRNSIGQQDALDYETNRQKAGFMDRILKYDLPEDFIDQQNEILDNITKEELDKLARKHLPYDQMAIVVVGDKASTYDDLTDIGYEVILLEPEI